MIFILGLTYTRIAEDYGFLECPEILLNGHLLSGEMHFP